MKLGEHDSANRPTRRPLINYHRYNRQAKPNEQSRTEGLSSVSPRRSELSPMVIRHTIRSGLKKMCFSTPTLSPIGVLSQADLSLDNISVYLGNSRESISFCCFPFLFTSPLGIGFRVSIHYLSIESRRNYLERLTATVNCVCYLLSL